MKFSSDEYFSRLMIEIMNEDEEDIAFSQLRNVIKAEVYNQICMSVDVQDREDILSEVIVVVVRQLPIFIQNSKDKSEAQRAEWIHRVTHGVIVAYYRQRKKNYTVPLVVPQFDKEDSKLKEIVDDKLNPEIVFIEKEFDLVYLELLQALFNIRTSPEKLMAFVYSRIIFNEYGRINGKSTFAQEHLHGKSLYQIMEEMQFELEQSFQKKIPSYVYEGLKKKLTEKDSEGYDVGDHIFELNVLKIMDGNSRIQKKMAKMKSDSKKGGNQ